MLNDKTILITGGTGYLGRHLAAYLLEHAKPRKLIIFSRDPHKQEWLRARLKSPRLRFFIGNVRDPDRLRLAMQGVDWVVHTAAIKTLSVCEYNPSEAVLTNVDGTRNVCDACYYERARMILISTDKAVEPINLYGMTKAVAESMTLHYNVYRPLYSVVRYGNVMGSTGSVLEKFQAQKKTDPFPITDLRMSRFWFSVGDAIRLILQTANEAPGTIIVGKAPSFRVRDLAKAIYVRARLREVGIHPGEKLHETLVGAHERAYDYGRFFKIVPPVPWNESVAYDTAKGKRFTGAYRSDENLLLKQDEIRKAIDENTLRAALPSDSDGPPGSGAGPTVSVPDPRPVGEVPGGSPVPLPE